MDRFLHKIRSRPRKERQRIVYGSAFVVTLLICGVWISLVQFDKHKKLDSASTNDQFAPLKSLTHGILNVWTSAKYTVPKQNTASVESSDRNTTATVTDDKDGAITNDEDKEPGGQVLDQPQPTEKDSSTPTL